MEVFIRKTSPRGFLKKVCFSNLCKEKRREKQNVNMPRQSFDIRENEQFSIEIKKCPCLFDKSNAEYKEKDPVENAWKETDNSLETEEGITLCYDYYQFLFHDRDNRYNGYISIPKIYIWLILLK